MGGHFTLHVKRGSDRIPRITLRSWGSSILQDLGTPVYTDGRERSFISSVKRFVASLQQFAAKGC